MNDGGSRSDPRPPLRLLHGSETLSELSTEFWRSQSTEAIVASLGLDQPRPLITLTDGTVIQGNRRISVLMERGYEVDWLPRIVQER